MTMYHPTKYHRNNFITDVVWVMMMLIVIPTCIVAFTPLKVQQQQQFQIISTNKQSTTKLYDTTTTSSYKYSKIFVAGGTRGVGRCIIDRLVQQQRQVVTLVRNDDDYQLLSKIDGVTPIKGDAFIIKDVEHAMDGCDAAITTLGGSTTDTGSRIDYIGNNHVIESAGILGITRVVLVTSIGCGTSKEAAPPTVFDALKDVLQAKEKAENILIKYYTNMNWTIIRPGGLKSEVGTGNAILTEDTMAIGSIHREDVAQLVIQALDAPSTERKIFSAIDPSITSSINTDSKQITAFAL